ncbi:MAG: MFS transporter [Pseudomonadota bacterium]|nr:MFS transporter [Pseudomonadota bacterium]
MSTITQEGLAPTSRKLGLGTRLAYGFGSIAYGVKNNGFDYFLLLFYSQVVGLDARLVGIAITTALVFDAISDPVVGYWSDNLRSRWGRRHPFMYASAIPVALSYFLLWNPPEGLGESGLFWYLLVFAVCIRTFITAYETPSSALAPELTDDYEERSALFSFRYYFGWTGGNAMSVAMFVLIFPAFATDLIADGRFNRDAYALYGVISSVLIFVSIAVSAVGTHGHIQHLKAPPPQRQLTLGRIFAEIVETLSNRSFIALFIAAIFGAVAAGLSSALAFYIWTYFWGFSSEQTGVITLGVFISAVIGTVLAPVVTRRFGKKTGAMISGLAAFIGVPLPVVLRLLGVLPEDETFVFWFVFVSTVLDVGLIICFQIQLSSMMADLVEQSELQTGRRSEGIFYSAVTFIRKSVQGFGILAASFVLYLAGLESGAAAADVSDETVWRLGAYYVPSVLGLYLTMMVVISFYRLDRGEHEENLRKLAAARADAK